MDSNGMWEDTCLIVSTDHGFLLSEHGWWGKIRMPYYEEISHIPLMIHHPGFKDRAGQRRNSLTQAGDLMPTFMEFYGLEIPGEVRARSLLPVLDNDLGQRDAAVFGVFSGPIGVTDGEWVLYHYPPDILADGLVEYTLAPNHMTVPFEASELRTARLAPPFDFTKGIPLLAIDALKGMPRPPGNDGKGFDDLGTRVYNLARDPRQENPLTDKAQRNRLTQLMIDELKAHDTPTEVYEWYGLVA
jgi:hypothetical protein